MDGKRQTLSEEYFEAVGSRLNKRGSFSPNSAVGYTSYKDQYRLIAFDFEGTKLLLFKEVGLTTEGVLLKLLENYKSDN